VSDKTEQELLDACHAWDRAMVTNDADAIGAFMSDDWIIIGSDGNICDKATFLGLVKSGALTHDVMESHDMNVRVYRDTAVVVGRGVSGGKYQGHPFHEVERVTCVFVRQKGQWKCVLTHLSRIAQPDA
jgi:ketosteroid isomerase-like protein